MPRPCPTLESSKSQYSTTSCSQIEAFAPGSVCLVGAGPGDPDLITLKAIQRLQRADVVLYDHLLSPLILEWTTEAATRICVGKRANRHTLPQDEINLLLIQFAKAGQRVVRLKGGDPLLFGRGGEELECLIRAGISCEVIPGVSAALGAAAALGMPLTHRDHAQGCHLVTGHRREGVETLNWTQYSQPDQTLVVYMGLGEASHIARQLIDHGRSPNTHVAIIERACTSQQRCVHGQLEQLGTIIRCERITTPALLVIGDIVALHQKLQRLKQQFGNP